MIIKNKTGATVLGVAALSLVLAACGSSSTNSSSTGSSAAASGSGTISGAGSTFAAPVYEQWGSQISGLTVNYQPVGSGAGITALEGKTVDFGASDPPLKSEEETALGKVGEPVQIPMFLGAITVSYNLPGVATGLKLDGKTIADIFMGKVKKWNDPEIAGQNSGVTLPSTNITIVHRSDESGTTKGFTTFLSDVSPEWKSKIGADKTVKWPTGTGAKGNDGVAAAVKQTAGAVGYVEQAYALQNNFTTANVKNSAGNYIAPSLQSTSAAGEGLKIPADLGISTINASGAQAYPIASQTFIDVYKDPCKAGMSQGDAKALAAFLNFGLGKGQDELGQLYYAKLPAPILAKSKAAVSSLTCNGSPLGS